MGQKTMSEKKSKRRRKTKAALVAGAVGSTVAATAAYRRRNAHRHLGNAARQEHPFATPTATPPTDFGAGPEAGPGATQPL